MSFDFDASQLDAVTGGDSDFEREVLETFLDSAPKDVARVCAALTTNDGQAASAAAHALKGAGAAIGGRGLAAAAKAVELAARAGEFDAAPALVGRLRSEFDELSAYLRTRIAQAA
ncbi:MAG TPA: Hpt domain-containing protein [Candidatus Eisenbacteria bacterium]|nr:Hpt domain-containing protein [Candidatus Eisenbacteria bacterium]